VSTCFLVPTLKTKETRRPTVGYAFSFFFSKRIYLSVSGEFRRDIGLSPTVFFCVKQYFNFVDFSECSVVMRSYISKCRLCLTTCRSMQGIS